MRASRARARGVASTEAVVALPFLLLVLVAVAYVRSAALEQRQATAHARACAWAYSKNNCDAVPPGCEGVLEIVEGGAVADSTAQELADGTALVTAASPVIGGVVEGLLEPVLRAAFGRFTRVEVTRDVARPALLGGEHGRMRGDYYLACNLRPMELEDVALDAWKMVVP